MKKLTFALMLLTFVPAVRSQTRDCACESQVLPETLALVNGVKSPASILKNPRVSAKGYEELKAIVDASFPKRAAR